MAVASILPDSPVESVKHAVRSASTCSNATVLVAQSLLRESPKSQDTNSNPVRTIGKATKGSTATSGAKTSRGPGKGATVNSVVESEGARLSTQERLVLATELFNTSLKTLSGEVKVSGSKHRPADDRPKTPLQPSSPNRTRSSAKKTISSKYTQSSAESQDGLVAVAECARFALSSLRTLKGDQLEENGYPNIQLEQGACVLAGRLIALGLNDMAYKELKFLKRRISQYLDQKPDGRKSAARSKTRCTEEEPAKCRMSDLLTFTDLTRARPLHGLLVSFQANAMRLIAAEKKQSTVQKICQSLQLSDPSSPAKIIMAAVDSGSLPSDKAALQLQMLSNTVLSLCSGARQSSEVSTSRSREELKPITTLTLQLLSLEIKCIGWKFSGHECDEAKEMWDPLARYLGAFAHLSDGVERSEFISMYRTVIRLRSSIAETKKSTVNLNTASVARITTILGQLAQDSGCFEEALKLFTEALTPLSNGQCLALATVRCKLASTHFQALRSSGKNFKSSLPNAISETSTAMGLPLKGSPNDLDELLVESAKLKKFAMAWLGSVSNGRGNGFEGDCRDRIREYLQTFLRFLRRYIGRQPSEDDEVKDHEAFYKKISMSKSIVLAAVDSAVVMGKVFIASQSPGWEEMLSILVDCQRLLTTIEYISEDTDSGADSIGLGFVKLSNLFWSRYIKEKESEKDYRHLIPLLKQSTNMLSTCLPTQRNVGFAAVKFERLAHLYLEGNMGTESEKAFCQSIKEHIDAGALQEVATDVPVFHDPKGSGFLLGRVLSAFLKTKLRQKDPKTFDDESLASEKRGLILEWQMHLLTELHGHAYSSGQFRSVFSLLLSKILDVYSIEAYPIRRLRVMLYAIRFSLERPASAEPALLHGLIEECEQRLESEEDIRNDSMLSPFLTHIKNSLRLTIGLHKGSLRPDELSQVISSWSSMVRDAPDHESLNSRISDLEHLVLQIKAVVDYTEIHGLWKIQLSALELILRINELQESPDFSDVTIILSRLVLQYCRLGHCRKAGDLLARAGQYLSQNEVSCLATLSHKLARVEFLLETGDAEKAAGVLSAARALYERNKLDLGNISVLSKIAWERLVADAAFIHSRLSFAQGSTTQALFFAKLSVRLNCRLWAKVEKISHKKQDKIMLESGSSDIDTVVEGMAKLEVSQSPPDTTFSYSQGAPFWPHIESHHTALLNLSSLSAHHGLFQDAIYYGEQALKINKTLNANVRLVASQAQLGSQWIFGGHISEGQELLTTAAKMSEQLDSSVELASLQMALASLHKAQGRRKDELGSLLEADRIIAGFINSDDSIGSKISDLGDKMDKLRIRGASKPQQQPVTTGRRTRAATSASKTASKKTTTNPEPTIESKSLLQLRGDILLEQAGCSRALRDFDHAADLLNDARKFAVSKDSQIPLHIGESENLLADAIRRFATHAVYCVLPESTISLPALQSPKRAVDTAPSTATTKPSAVRRQRTTSKAPRASEDFSVMLSKAGDCLNSVFDAATVLGSTLDSHAASRLMSRISMLAHATTPGCSVAWSSPANVNEIGRVGAFTRERRAIDIDKQLAGFSDPLVWPTPSISAVELDDTMCSDFTKEYVDILPESWNVLSLSVSADRTEFVVSRLRKGHSPFLLRLPLKRGNSEEDEEEQFTFDDGREEMQEIIKLANESAHSARAQTDKHSKREWWRNREALDQRLEGLLQNIENVWFGGFKGIFSPVPREMAPLAQFAKSFYSILDNHLPSRRKGGRSGAPKLTLHQNVLELFVGIKDLEEQEDPEDTLMDLLYFVVDILQFQGERNAYDEIDFDMMVVDTLDALRSYRKAVDEEEQLPQHTVLVLDKALHLFPWESLPSLQGYPVCRVPSLECLRQRVQQFQIKKTGHSVHVDRGDGTYILNPAGDLRTTQVSFEGDLSGLDGWRGIVQREPSEEEFKHALESRSLLLYFGHGSGAQYIRGRTIKRLERCAVTFLMGCSSGTLTEAGEYEPYGTPMNYLQAGSPAFVATLWDVTDKDIDRFARSTFERWGLLGRGEDRALDEAVSTSRGACVLRYLNGAAPVVYGVPGVFLA